MTGGSTSPRQPLFLETSPPSSSSNRSCCWTKQEMTSTAAFSPRSAIFSATFCPTDRIGTRSSMGQPMLVGHYGPAFVLKSAEKTIPLWVLFVAVQWMDVLWAGLVGLGIERFRVVPGFTATNALELYYMPITHSLPGSVLLSLLLGAVVAAFYPANRGRVLLVVALAVFSHWLIDLIVHVPDLPLWDDRYKVGFGLWNYFWIALALEFAILIGGAWYYMRIVPSARPRGDVALWLFVG